MSERAGLGDPDPIAPETDGLGVADSDAGFCLSFRTWVGLAAAIGLAWTSSAAISAEPGAAEPILSTSTGTVSGPRLEIENVENGALEIGTVRQQQIITLELLVRNGGNQRLEISAVRPDCECLEVVDWPAELGVGEGGSITFRLLTLESSGLLRHALLIDSSDPAESCATVEVRADVWVPIQAEPPTASFRDLASVGTEATQIIRLVNRMDEPVELRHPRSSNRAFGVDLQMVVPGREYALKVSTVPPLKLGPQWGTLTLETSAEVVPSVSIRAFANVRPPIEVSPRQLLLPAGRLNAEMRLELRVRGIGLEAFHLLKVQPHLRGLRTQIKPASDRAYLVEVLFPKGMKLNRAVHPVVTIFTDHPQMPRIEVPLLLLQGRPSH